jgi:GMP synthase (glutamine-hydrolysing)
MDRGAGNVNHGAIMPKPSSTIARVVRHVPFEDLGSFAPLLERRGYRVDWREAGVDDLEGLDALAPDLLIVLGGPIGANDEADYPFLRDELRMIETRISANRPTLGICLGAQLIARAAGGRVYPAAAKEIGWAPLVFTEAGRRSPLAPLAETGTPVLHWHGDTFDLPTGATLLASTPGCPNQAFSMGERVLGLQFHIEVTAAGLERWFIGHAAEIGATRGVDVGILRADTERFAQAAERQGKEAFAAWLAGIG